jgi:hypothetical protein
MPPLQIDAYRRNALKTGIVAKSQVLPAEERGSLQLVANEYYARFHPSVPEERTFVDELICCEWTLRRLRSGEVLARSYNSFSRLERRVDGTRRAFHRALAALKQIQAESKTPDPPSAPQSAALQAGRVQFRSLISCLSA